MNDVAHAALLPVGGPVEGPVGVSVGGPVGSTRPQPAGGVPLSADARSICDSSHSAFTNAKITAKPKPSIQVKYHMCFFREFDQ